MQQWVGLYLKLSVFTEDPLKSCSDKYIVPSRCCQVKTLYVLNANLSEGKKSRCLFFTWSDLFWDRFINRRGQRVFSTNRNARFYLTTKPWKSLKWGFQQDFLSYAWIQMKFKFFKSKLSRKKSDLICDLRINQSDKPKNKTKSMSANSTFCTTDVRVRRGLNSRGPCSLNACTSLPVKSILLK